FRELYRVQPGEPIVVYTADGEFTYRVETLRLVTPAEVDVLAPADAPLLTLVTCAGEFNFRTHSFSHRLLVRGRLVTCAPAGGPSGPGRSPPRCGWAGVTAMRAPTAWDRPRHLGQPTALFLTRARTASDSTIQYCSTARGTPRGMRERHERVPGCAGAATQPPQTVAGRLDRGARAGRRRPRGLLVARPAAGGCHTSSLAPARRPRARGAAGATPVRQVQRVGPPGAARQRRVRVHYARVRAPGGRR